MNETPEVEITGPETLTFAQKWHAEKMLKKAKKKSRKTLEKQGFSRGEAASMVKKAVRSIATNKPMKRAAGRGG
jgi:uncharacterized protein YoaH (UPF0181 family)